MSKRNTVRIGEVSTLRMVAGNEAKHPVVIHNDNLREWVGFGWITLRAATDKDRGKYPTVVES